MHPCAPEQNLPKIGSLLKKDLYSTLNLSVPEILDLITLIDFYVTHPQRTAQKGQELSSLKGYILLDTPSSYEGLPAFLSLFTTSLTPFFLKQQRALSLQEQFESSSFDYGLLCTQEVLLPNTVFHQTAPTLTLQNGQSDASVIALAQLYNIFQHAGYLDGLTIALCGDCLGAQAEILSLIFLLTRLGSSISLICPRQLCPSHIEEMGTQRFSQLEEGLSTATYALNFPLTEQSAVHLALRQKESFGDRFLAPPSQKHPPSQTLYLQETLIACLDFMLRKKGE